MSKLLHLLQTLQDSLNNVSINVILEIVSHLFKLGPPPNLQDTDALRHWLQGLLPVLDTISELTPMDLDDQLVVLARVAVEDDEAWEALHSLLMLVSDGRVEADVNAKTLSYKVGMDITTIMAVVEMIMKIIEMLRR